MGISSTSPESRSSILSVLGGIAARNEWWSGVEVDQGGVVEGKSWTCGGTANCVNPGSEK